MKVLHLITGLGTGGAERHLVQMLPHLHRTEHVVCAILPKKDVAPSLARTHIPVYYLNKTHVNMILSAARLERIIRKERPDILCTYLIHADLLGRFVGRIYGVSYIICNIRIVPTEQYARDTGKSLLMLERKTSWLVDRYIANSQTAYRALSKYVPRRKLAVIPNGIDLELISKAIPAKRKHRGALLICIGRLHQQKGQTYLLEAMPTIVKAIPSVLLLMVGDGPKKAAYQQQTRQLGVTEHVQFLGRRTDATELLKSADIFVLPTLYEGMSNALLEAMACSVPIVTTNIPENKELLSEREAVFVPPRDARRLANAVVMLLKSKKKASTLAQRARRRVQEHALDKTAAAFEQEYLRLNYARSAHVRH